MNPVSDLSTRTGVKISVASPSALEERIKFGISVGELLRVRTLLQNSITTLGDASVVGGANVAGSVWDTLGAGCCRSQSAQLESAIEMKHDKSSKLIR